MTTETDVGVQVEVGDGVAHLRFDRAERRNTVTGPVVDELLEGLRASRTETSVILLSGAGDHLCAGLDIDAFNVEPAPEWKAGFGGRWRELHVELWEEDRPLVVAHSGAAVGAGSALLFASDVAVSGRSAFAHVVETAIGMLAPINIAWLVARHTPAVAAELALLAERVGAERLRELGVVSEVVDDDAVLEKALDRARRLAGFPSAPVAATRRAVRDLSGVDFAEMIASAQAHGQGLGGPRRQAR